MRAKHNFTRRFENCLQRLEETSVDVLLVTHPPNLKYLFDFFGSAGFGLISESGSTLIVDFRYYEIARQDAVNCKVTLAEASLEEQLEQTLTRSFRQARVGFEAHHMTVDLFSRLSGWMQHKPVATTDVLEQLRAVKEASEQAKIEKAVLLAQEAFDDFYSELSEDIRISETTAAGLLDLKCREKGSQGPPFETIVASGTNSALPHARPGPELIRLDEPLLIDFGFRYEGYCSDLTRSILPEGHTAGELLSIVQEARQAAISTIRAGVESAEVDRVARAVIESQGYDRHFGHGLGHGVGLEVHELPPLSPLRSMELAEGMVVTIEPGIYLPGRHGVRLEDVVVVTGSGCRILGTASEAS